MAIHKGSEGTVHIDTDAVAEIKSYSVEETSDTVEVTSMGDGFRDYLPTLTSFSGSIDVFWDEDDTAQQALTVGTEVTIKFYAEGTTTGAKYYTGTAIVTGLSISASFDGMVEASISVQGKSALTLATA
jgi:predicted secreted protein